MGVDAHGPFPFPGHDSRFHGALSNSNIIHLGRSIGARFGLGDIEGLTVVVDTNVVLGELRWLAKQPGRPVLDAAVAGLSHSGVLRPVCPRLLGEEVERHLPRIAERIGVTVAALEVVWRCVRTSRS